MLQRWTLLKQAFQGFLIHADAHGQFLSERQLLKSIEAWPAPDAPYFFSALTE
jgi:hypothetical protein